MAERSLRALSRRLMFGVFLMVLPVLARAAPVVVEDAADRYNLAPAAEYLRDPEGTLDIQRVTAPASGLDWQPVTEKVPNFGYASDAFWFKFSLRHDGNEELSRLLEVGYPLLNQVDVYAFGADGRALHEFHVGDAKPFDQRPYLQRTFVLPLTLPAGEPVDVYLRVQSTSSVQIPLNLWSPAALQAKSERELGFYAVYSGLMLGMIVYNLFLFFSVRLRAYLYYVLFISGSSLLFLEMRGFNFQFLWPNAIWWQEHGIAFLAALMPVAGCLFAISFLNLRSYSRALVRWMQLPMVAGIAGACLVPFIPYQTAIKGVVINVLVWVVLMVGAGIYALVKGEKAARYYLLAWAAFLLAAFLTAVYQFGILPKTVGMDYIAPIGASLEALLLSFALADRFNQMREEKVAAQRYALESLQRYEMLYREARYGIITTTLEGHVLGANPAMAAMLGYGSPQEFRNAVSDIAGEIYADASERRELIQRLTAEGHVDDFQARLYRKDGSEVWVSMSARLVSGPEGSLIEGSLTDITERRRREQAERARELAEKERAAAEAATRAKSTFLSNMSHEIRTPLTAIIGYGEFLLEPNVPEGQRRDLARTIVRSGRHLLEIINDILDLSKIEAGRLEVERITVDLPELMAEVASAFEVRARQKGLDFKVDYRFPLPRRIVSDPTRLKQILYNLCGNALKFTDNGSVTVAVSCDAGAQKLRIAVIDTGIGIPADHLARLFQPFTQADASTTRRFGGTGLGLSISRQLAQILGGEIFCESMPGAGSRFELEVSTGPLVDVPVVHDRGEALVSPVADAQLKVPRLRGRVLHAEDNRESAKLVSMLVRQTGVEIVTVENGLQAVERAAQEEFDLALLDIQMPVMDGFGALAALRRNGFVKPICALTANVMAEDRASYQAAGFDACEAKPVDRAALYRLLARHLPPELAAPPAEPELPQVRGRILVAEDNPDSRRLIEWYCRRTGAEVELALDGRAAVEAVMSRDFDLVLMDQEMPTMTGLEATRLLRQTGSQVPVYLFTADADVRTRNYADTAGCQGTLSKPIDVAALYEVVARCLQPVAAAATVDGLDAELAALGQAFLDGLPELLGAMAMALEARDWPGLAGLAHQLKGSGGSFGYDRLSALAAVVEKAAKAGEGEQIEAAFAPLRAEIQSVLSPA